MSYLFPDKFTLAQRYEAEEILHKAIDLGWSSNKLQREAMSLGLSYRRQDMLYNLRRAESMHYAKTDIAKERAVRYFEDLFEPHRKAMGWTSAQETEFRNKGKAGLFETTEEMEEYEEEWEKYERWWEEFVF
jgi:hypothetical protein